MTRTSFLRTGLTALAALVLLTVSSPVAQADELRGADFKCMHDVVPGATATATLKWYIGTPLPDNSNQVGVTANFTCTQATTDSQTITQPTGPTTGADNWKVEVQLVTSGGNTFNDSATGTFVANTFPRIRERFTNFSEGTLTFALSRN